MTRPRNPLSPQVHLTVPELPFVEIFKKYAPVQRGFAHLERVDLRRTQIQPYLGSTQVT